VASWPYNTTRWLKLRAAHLARYPWCEACLPTRTLANTVDHRKAISDGGEAFPTQDGLASLCASHHSMKTARGVEHGAVRTARPIQPRKGCSADGMPLDPTHPWNEATKKLQQRGS
jgi:5-methylcytosine-specific restriction protein A